MVDVSNELNTCFGSLAGNKESTRLSYSLFPHM